MTADLEILTMGSIVRATVVITNMLRSTPASFVRLLILLLQQAR
jgi:hypothetical protein